MITTPKQLAITKKWRAKFQKSLDETKVTDTFALAGEEPVKIHPTIRRALILQYESIIEEFDLEIREWEQRNAN